MIAYSATKANSTEIWVKPTQAGDPIQVTKNGFYNLYPIWSQNGDELVFLSNRKGERGMWRASFTGGEQKKILALLRQATCVGKKSGTIYFKKNPNCSR